MKRVYTFTLAILLLLVFGCIDDIFYEQAKCCDTAGLVKNVKLVNEEGDWSRNVDFDKIKLFETYENGDLLQDKSGKVVESISSATPIYNNNSEPLFVQLQMSHLLGYDETRHFSLKINDSIYHKISVKYNEINNKLVIRDFNYQGDSIFKENNGILHILIEKSTHNPSSPKCEDSNAINNGEELPCEYPSPKCEDPNAVNNGGELPCEYPSLKCEDSNAINNGGELPCEYPSPKCEDPNAVNNGGELPCKYLPTYPPFKISEPVYLIDWMKYVDDNAPISGLSIPGTHNSGARKEQEVNISKCQDWNFQWQLEKGIRFLDLRINSKLELNHGGWYQYENLNDVIRISEDFLKKYPTETIIMSIKQEDSNSNDFANIVGNVIKSKPELWYLDSKIPRMGEVRGKIILFRRYSASENIGISMSRWSDNRTFTNGNVTVQDQYNIGGLNSSNVQNKWKYAKELIDRSIRREGNRMYVNFLNASGGLATPKQYAWGTKWWEVWNGSTRGVMDYFQDYLNGFNLRGKSHGIIVMDYPDAIILKLLINTNFSTHL